MKKLLLTTLIFIGFNGLLRAQCAGNCTLYTVANIPYSLTPVAGVAVVLSDDQVSAALPIGFTFTFMCNAYTNFYISSNGFISFNAGVSNGCCSGQAIPSPGNAVNNMIAWDWNDLYPPGAGTIRYQTTGVSPNRRCIVTYTGIPHCCNAGPPINSGQIILYETSNRIEIYSAVVTNDGSTNTQGIMDASGNVAYSVAGRNGVAWTANNDAYRFTPSATTPSCTGAPTPGSAVANPSLACLTVTTNLSLTGTSGTCGATYQWQSATALGGPYANIAGATNPTAVASTTVTRYYRCILTCAGSSGTSTPATVSITPGPCPTCVGQYYVHSNIGDPWGQTTNQSAMNAVFGATWTAAFFETVNVASMLQPTISLIFLEGGDNNANAMNTFVTANIAALQTWVNNGGKLLMNSAPNVGGNMNWGFGGVMLNYAVGPYSGDAFAAVGQAGHPIFNGPFLPAGTGTYTGNWFCHGYVNGGGLTNVIVGSGTPGGSLAEKTWGSGRLMAGSMTTDNFHLPAPNSANLVKNILSYLNCAPVPLPVELTDYYLTYNNEYCTINWATASERNSDYFIVEKSTDGFNYSFLDKMPAAVNSREPKKYFLTDFNPNKHGINYYRLKQFDKGNNLSKLNLIKTLNINEKNKHELKVHPNPANSNLLVSLPESLLGSYITLQVFDYSGKRVLNNDLSKVISSGDYNLNIESLQPGLYSVNIFDESGASYKTTFIKN